MKNNKKYIFVLVFFLILFIKFRPSQDSFPLTYIYPDFENSISDYNNYIYVLNSPKTTIEIYSTLDNIKGNKVYLNIKNLENGDSDERLLTFKTDHSIKHEINLEENTDYEIEAYTSLIGYGYNPKSDATPVEKIKLRVDKDLYSKLQEEEKKEKEESKQKKKSNNQSTKLKSESGLTQEKKEGLAVVFSQDIIKEYAKINAEVYKGTFKVSTQKYNDEAETYIVRYSDNENSIKVIFEWDGINYSGQYKYDLWYLLVNGVEYYNQLDIKRENAITKTK